MSKECVFKQFMSPKILDSASAWTQKCNYHIQNSLMGEHFNEFQLFKLGYMFLKSSCQQIMSLAVSEHNLSSTAMSTHLFTTSPQHRVLASDSLAIQRLLSDDYPTNW